MQSSLKRPGLILAACVGALLLLLLFTRLSATAREPQVRLVAEGLLGPVGMAALPDGALLVAEEGTGENDTSAGVSVVTPDGQVTRLVSGLPSSRDSGDLAGVALVARAPEAATIYLGNFGQGHLWTLPLTAALTLPDRPLTPEQLTPQMLPLNNVRLVNPFDIAFDPKGVPVVTDASGNGVAKLQPDGTTRFIHRFDPLPNPARPGTTIEAVPTGITRIDAEYYVTLTGGCPYPEGGGKLVAIDEERNQYTVADGLNMPIDVTQGADGTIWVLEFARFTADASCFSGAGYQEQSGRLSRLRPDGTLDPVRDNLNFPGALLAMPDGSLYLSEVFPGRILHVTFGPTAANQPASAAAQPTAGRRTPSRAERPAIDPDQYDALLQEIIAHEELEPHPGSVLREADTPQARLGQALFFDPILSGDRNIACATCHHPAFAMADGRALPIGTSGHGLGPQRTFLEEVTLGDEAGHVRCRAGQTDPQSGQTVVANPFVGAFVPRNSPTIINSALFPTQFWDSRVEHAPAGQTIHTQEELVTQLYLDDPLTAQAFFPVTSLHEMAGATLGDLPPPTIRAALLERLRASPAYRRQFAQVWPDTPTDPETLITQVRMAEALAAFQRRFILTSTPWDAYLAGNRDALSAQQKRGALLFYGAIDPAVNCAGCHRGNLFSDFEHHNLLVPQLGPGKGDGYSGREDWGRGGVTFDPQDRYTFRTPTLRNVELTAPYFHDGAFATLTATIRHHADIRQSAATYDPDAHGLPPALYSSLRPFDPQQELTAAPELRDGLPLDAADIADLVAFLGSLTDPAARDLRAFIPESVPSGLPLDPLPDPDAAAPAVTVAAPATDAATDDLPATRSDLRLRDVAAAVGLDFRHGAFRTAISANPAAAMGGGLCWIDYDNDGRLDLYLVNSHAEEEAAYWQAQGGLPRNALYRNLGGRFRDVSRATGTDLALRGNGCVAADFDGDGRMDLYITADGPNALLWNNGDGSFLEGAAAAGVAAPEWNSAAVVGDLNGDGRPDLFVAGYIDLDHRIPKPSGAFPQDYYGLPDRLYLNAGPAPDGATPAAFREVTIAAGLAREERGLGALLSDLDQDGDLDLYIANDGQPNRLYANTPLPGGAAADPAGLGFRLQDLTDSANVGDSGSGMGVAGGDYDGDGWTDLFVTNWERELNALYRNEYAEAGDLTFRYSTFRIGISGLGNGMTGWGTALLDLDQDTDQDLLIVNGRVPVTNLRSDPELIRLYRNRSWDAAGEAGRPGHFREWTEQAGLKEIGPQLGRGSAVADYDNDGDLDIAINTIAGHALLLRNDGQHGNWLQVDLAGFHPGARVTLTLPDGRRLVREVYAGSSYLASEDPRLHFGLGQVQSIPHLTLHLPDGRTHELRDVAVNQRLVLP